MKIAIPSHKRLVSLNKIVEMIGGDAEISVFIGDVDYFNEVFNSPLADVVTLVKVPCFTNISALRNQILEHYQEGDEIVCIDDDITKVFALQKGKLVEINKKNLETVFKKGFEMCRKMGYKLGGVAPFSGNAFYMKNQISLNKFCVGCLFGVIKGKIRFDEKAHTKEDYDFSLQHITQAGGNLRFDFICTNNDYGKTKGGLQDRGDREKIGIEVSKYLIEKRSPLVKKRSEPEIEFDSRYIKKLFTK